MTTQYTSLLPSKYDEIKEYIRIQSENRCFNIGDKIIILNYRARRLEQNFLKKLLINWAKKINQYSIIYDEIYSEYKNAMICTGINMSNTRNLGLHTDDEIILNTRTTIKLRNSLMENKVWFNIPEFRTSRHKDLKFKPGLIGYIYHKLYYRDLDKYVYTVDVYDLGKYIGKGTWFCEDLMSYSTITGILNTTI
tara:strand:+ start:638 stop:1219 length:582 start_codon:yes stop_codon:yes gene_type:complete